MIAIDGCFILEEDLVLGMAVHIERLIGYFWDWLNALTCKTHAFAKCVATQCVMHSSAFKSLTTTGFDTIWHYANLL